MGIQSFSVHKEDVVLVKPAQTLPSETLCLSTMDNNHHLELHCHAIYVYEANPHATTDDDPVSVVKEALSRVLVYYYPLAGKVKRYEDDGKLRIAYDPSDDLFGVPFLEATADCDLSDLRYFEDNIDANDVRSFFFQYSPKKEADVDGHYHPLVMQVTRFACGGFTVSMGLLHSVSDGQGAARLFRDLGELASGKSELSIKPVWERERLQGTASNYPLIFPEDNLPLVTSPFLPSSDMVHEWINIEGESINKLRYSNALYLPKENGPNDHVVIELPTLTSMEILGSLIWKARFRALEQNLDGKTTIMLIMGVKHLLNPPLPQGYYGNVIVASQACLTGKELSEGSLHDVAKVIKGCKKVGSNLDYVNGSVDFLETVIEQKVNLELGGSIMLLTDCRQLGWLEVADFGWKKPVNMIPVPWSMINGHIDNCVMLAPNYIRGSTSKGGVRILISLPRDAMPKFKEELHALLKV